MCVSFIIQFRFESSLGARKLLKLNLIRDDYFIDFTFFLMIITTDKRRGILDVKI